MAAKQPIILGTDMHELLAAGDTLVLPAGAIDASALSGTGSSSGQVLVSTGASSSPTWQAPAAPVAGSITSSMFAAGSEATTADFGTVKYSNAVTVLGGAGNAVVTDAVLKYALWSGQSYKLDLNSTGEIALFVTDGTGSALRGAVVGSGASSAITGAIYSATASGNGVLGLNASNGNGDGVKGEVAGTGGGNGVTGLFTGTGGGNGVYGAVTNSGNGHSGAFEIGGTAAGTGTGSAIYAVSYLNGTRDNVARFDRLGANTTWGITTNAGIFTAGGVTTSDKRVKANFEDLNADIAIKLLDNIKFYQYDKLMDKTGILKMQDEQRAKGKAELSKLEIEKKDLASLAKGGKKSEQPFDDSKLREAQELAECVFPTDDKSLFVAIQAGVIAQELQELTNSLGAYQWLVSLSNPNDKESILVVDYTSLYSILAFAQREKSNRLEARIAALEAR